MRWLDWTVVVAYLVLDRLRRPAGEPRAATRSRAISSANRSLPWWAVGLSVMATQMSAITLVGTTGQGYRDGLRFVQFYRPAGRDADSLGDGRAVLLSRAGLHRLRVPGTAVRREDAHAHERAVPALARALLRRHHRRSRGHPVDCPAVEPDTDRARDRAADRRLHDVRRRAGRHVDRRETDGGHRGGRRSGHRRAGLAPSGGRDARPGPGDCRQHGPSAGPRFPRVAHRDVHVLVRARRRAVPDARVLRLRPEPGAAVLHGQIRRRGPFVAHDERLREDPVPGADPPHGGARLLLLPVHAAAHAVQPAARGARAGERSRRRVRGPCRPASIAPSRRGSTPRSRSHRRARAATTTVRVWRLRRSGHARPTWCASAARRSPSSRT